MPTSTQQLQTKDTGVHGHSTFRAQTKSANSAAPRFHDPLETCSEKCDPTLIASALGYRRWKPLGKSASHSYDSEYHLTTPISLRISPSYLQSPEWYISIPVSRIFFSDLDPKCPPCVLAVESVLVEASFVVHIRRYIIVFFQLLQLGLWS